MPDQEKDIESTPDNVRAQNGSLTVLDKQDKAIDFGKIIIELAALSEDGNKGVTTVEDVTALRKLEPSSDAEIAVMLNYTKGTRSGGGAFIYDSLDKTSKDDGGLIFVTPKGARWKRGINDMNDVNVVAFGAVSDGKTDCLAAVNRMWAWSQANSPHIGIKFPAGTFFISSFDISDKEISHFRLVGDHVNFGYYPSTRLVSDKKNDEVMFKIKARWMTISALEIDGESSNSAPNTKGFFKNIITAGQYSRVTSMNFLNLGGRGLDMLDTLDCKIDQWYAKQCTGTVIYASWSNDTHGKWDHITAIELSNFNIQHCTKNPAIDLQRAGQSMIWNGWIEHTEYPGNLSNGQWTFHALSIEDCQNAMACHYSRIINIQFNQQGNSGLDFSESGDTWDLVSEFERGNVHIENHGINISGSLNYQYLTSPDYMDNRTGSERWFYLGEFFVKLETAQVHIHIVGSAFYSNMSETQIDYTDRTAEGSADIYLQKKDSKTYIASWVGQGSVPVKRVLLQPGSSAGKVKMYVRLEKYTGYCIALMDTNDYDHFNAGDNFRFYKGYRRATSEEVAMLDAAPDNCFHQHWLGRDKVGLGFNNDNELLLRGKTAAVASFGNATQCLKVMINGKAYGLEMKPLK